jgi:hypothetical protein
MTFTEANDVAGPAEPCAIDMSVLDLAIFLRIHRSGRGTSAGEVAITNSRSFECDVTLPEVEGACPRMAEQGWRDRTARDDRRSQARPQSPSWAHPDARSGHQDARRRPHPVLQLAMIELDGEHDDDDDDDADHNDDDE